ncbi:MAG: ComEA family DNA-binding protein, partial [Candidatus Levyibacteriota bacterium]
QDAFIAAGGLNSSADRNYVARSINLASPLKDGMKIYVPKLGEAPSNSISSSTSTSNGSGPVSVNSASQEALEALPGIGPVTAGKIIAGRPYSSVDELLTKKAVGKSVYDKIKDSISL